MIATDRQPAPRAPVPTLAQSLGHGCAAGTSLAGAVGVNPDQRPTSVFSFVGELGQETAPSGVVDRLGQHPTGQPLDVQVLHGNQVVGVNDLPGDLVVEVRPLVANVNVDPLKFLYGLVPPVAAPLPTGHLALGSAKSGLRDPVVPGVLEDTTIAQDREALQPHVDAHGLAGGGQRLSSGDFNAKAGVPFPALPFQGERLDLPIQEPVKLDLDFPHALDVKASIVPELAAVAVGREGVAVEPGPGFEPGEACFMTSPDSAEESSVGLVDPPQHVLAGGVVGQPQVSGDPNRFELVGLGVVVDRDAAHAPGIPALLEGGVVEPTGFGQLEAQGLGLLPVGIEAVLEGFEQKLTSHE